MREVAIVVFSSTALLIFAASPVPACDDAAHARFLKEQSANMREQERDSRRMESIQKDRNKILERGFRDKN